MKRPQRQRLREQFMNWAGFAAQLAEQMMYESCVNSEEWGSLYLAQAVFFYDEAVAL